MKDSLSLVDEDTDIAMKVVIVGNGSVGKSSMIQRFCRGTFTREYKKTIGVDFLERVLKIDEHSVRLMLWDTAGQEEFDAITRTYYRGASACLLVCSITDRNSFNALLTWKQKVCRECGDIPMVLVANKYDLQKQSLVDSVELESMARSLGISRIFKTSVKEDVNIYSVFQHIAKDYLDYVLSLEDPEETNSNEVKFLENDLLFSTGGILKDLDKPHHKFHTPIFGHFLASSNNKQNNSDESKLFITNNKNGLKTKSLLSVNNSKNSFFNKSTPQLRSPVIYKSEKCLVGGNNKRGIFSTSRKSNYGFTPSGNHYTHWDNDMPFRLDLMNIGTKKAKKGFCTIL